MCCIGRLGLTRAADSMRRFAKSTAGRWWTGLSRRCTVTLARLAATVSAWRAVEEYGVPRLLEMLATELRESAVPAAVSPSALHPEAEVPASGGRYRYLPNATGSCRPW